MKPKQMRRISHRLYFRAAVLADDAMTTTTTTNVRAHVHSVQNHRHSANHHVTKPSVASTTLRAMCISACICNANARKVTDVAPPATTEQTHKYLGNNSRCFCDMAADMEECKAERERERKEARTSRKAHTQGHKTRALRGRRAHRAFRVLFGYTHSNASLTSVPRSTRLCD